MSTEIEIIEINMGDDISSIIEADLSRITEKNDRDIRAAISEAKIINQAREAKETAERSQELAIAAAFTALKENGQVNGKQLLALVQPGITNMISLVQRLKSYLKNNRLPHALRNTKIGKDSFYSLSDQTTPESDLPVVGCNESLRPEKEAD